MNEELRKRLYAKVRAQHAQDPNVPPVVTLDEYFAGNSDESSIAPNQKDYGRPALREFHRRFEQIQAMPNVSAVLVGIHGDWQDTEKWNDIRVPAENIHIYTDASEAEVTRWIEGLAADGAAEGWSYGEHPAAPPLPAGHQVFTVFWD